MANVGIVIVSNSAKVAEGAADMVRQMVGSSVEMAWCGGNADGGLGTSAASILCAIEAAWTEAGVAVLVDLGGAETNSEMAIEMFDAGRRSRVVVCADLRQVQVHHLGVAAGNSIAAPTPRSGQIAPKM